MKLSAAHQPTGYVSRLQQSTLGWEVGRQIPRNANEDMPAPVAIAPLLELPHASLEHRSLAYAAALRVARFGTANEHSDWETAHHVFTYTNAVHQALKRIDSAGPTRLKPYAAFSTARWRSILPDI